MELSELRREAEAFAGHLRDVKKSTTPPPNGWYPPMLPGHIELLDRLLVGEHRRLLESPSPHRVADLGAADGDLGFFLQTVGFEVDIFDGARRPELLREPLGSNAEMHWVNLDHDFELPRKYELVFLLHVAYHLRNPMLTLGTLAHASQYCIFSTRIANQLRPGRLGRWRSDVTSAPVAYLLAPGELNPHDAHNYWIFSETGLTSLLTRCGWEILNSFQIGNPKAVPGDQDQQVMWCLLRSRVFAWSDAAE